jgi:serine/threonine protein kinase
MFPWADGGSLRNFWESRSRQHYTVDLVRQALVQLRGIADALDKLHHFGGDQTDSSRVEHKLGEDDISVADYGDAYESSQSIRHGDLKPENLLNFLGENDNLGLGVLKIADMGLAKRHVVSSQDWVALTSTRYGTIFYEAPEIVTTLWSSRSHLNDIWSMGCITLEFIIWMLFGLDGLNEFYHQLKSDGKQASQFYEIPDPKYGSVAGAEVHHIVLRWMHHIQNTDPECSDDSAIKDLLTLVRTKLLVIALPPGRMSNLEGKSRLMHPPLEETTVRHRGTALQFRDGLDIILSRSSEPKYLLRGNLRQNVKTPQRTPRRSELLSPVLALSNPAPRRETINPDVPDIRYRFREPASARVSYEVR